MNAIRSAAIGVILPPPGGAGGSAGRSKGLMSIARNVGNGPVAPEVANRGDERARVSGMLQVSAEAGNQMALSDRGDFGRVSRAEVGARTRGLGRFFNLVTDRVRVALAGRDMFRV